MVLFALSFQGQVEKYGAYVGIAAFLGLAVLSLLYFSQARELKRLREWAGRAPERALELEQRVVAQATATVARRGPAMPGAPAKGGIAPPRRLAEMPAPPGGAQAAAAGGQATELAEAVEADPATNGNVPPAAVPPLGPGGSVPAGPVPANGGAPDEAASEEPAEGEAAAASANGGAATDAETVKPDAAAGADAGSGVVPPQGTVAPAAGSDVAAPPGTGPDAPETESVPGEIPPAAAVPRATPAQRVGVTPRPAPMPLRQAKPSATPRGGGGRPAAPAARRPGAKPPRDGRSAGTIALLVGLAVLILGGGAFAASQLLGGDDTPTPPNRAAPPPTETAEESDGGGGNGGGAAAPPPAETNVAVLNGTTFTGLAGRLADEVDAEGYQRGISETNTRDQTIQESIVYYADGFRASAREVGKLLSIERAEPLDSETASLAPDADVVVLAGADQAP
jgi:LytR cell envelope-related transcriptional attenuator